MLRESRAVSRVDCGSVQPTGSWQPAKWLRGSPELFTDERPIMRTSPSTRLAATLALALLSALAPTQLVAQRSDSYTWKLGLNAGAMMFQTRSQDTKTIPSAGAHVLIMARKGGLIFG